jgi:hypothetical protein
MMKRYSAIALAIVMPLSANAQTPPPAPETVTQETGSTNDCQIFAVLAKAKIGWTAETPPPGHYTPIVNTTIYNQGTPSQRKRIYTSTCPWRAFGLAEPLATEATPTITFTRPEYSDWTHARVIWQKITLTGRAGQAGLQFEGEVCRMELHNDIWGIASCEPAFRVPAGLGLTPPH